MKDKLIPLVDLLASDQEVAEKARSCKFFALSDLLGGCTLMP